MIYRLMPTLIQGVAVGCSWNDLNFNNNTINMHRFALRLRDESEND